MTSQMILSSIDDWNELRLFRCWWAASKKYKSFEFAYVYCWWWWQFNVVCAFALFLFIQNIPKFITHAKKNYINNLFNFISLKKIEYALLKRTCWKWIFTIKIYCSLGAGNSSRQYPRRYWIEMNFKLFLNKTLATK